MEWLNFRSLIKKLSIVLFCLYASLSFIEAADRIMPFGDSITKGYVTGVTPADEWGYRGLLWTKLRESGHTLNFVGDETSGENYTTIDPTFDANHSGVNNETTADLLLRTNATLINNDPQVVLLHIGTNDIDQGLDLNTSVTNVNTTLQNIYDYNSSIKVFLARIINLKSDADPILRANITAYNDALETMANTRIENGDNLQIVNMESGTGIDYTTDMAGPFHPNQNGYDLMAKHWYAALNGEVHHWSLDENTGTIFLDAMGSADGTCTGNCPSPSAGIKDGAQLFDGTTEVNITETATFDMPADANFTIELWVQTTDSGALKVMIGRDDGTTTSLHWWIGMESTGEVLFTLQDRDGVGAAYPTIKSTTPINDGDWHHIAAVRDGSTGDTILYVDGSAEASYNFTSTGGFAASTPVTIGYFINDGSAGFYFDGVLDEIFVYNRVLSATEIQAHYNDSAMQITTAPVTFAEVGVLYYYDANTSKDPVDAFDWTISKPASWMSINVDGEVSGTPDSVANLDVNITAMKGIETATQNYVLKVRDRSLLPLEMVHYWKLDEGNNTTTYLDSYSAVDATCTGSTCPISTIGQVSNAQLFDGAEDGLNVSDASTFDVPADANFTIELWAKTNHTGTLTVMIGRDDGTTTSLHWWIGMESTGEALFTLQDRDGAGAAYQTIKSTTPINDGAWHHIAAVREGSTGDTILYVDGTEESSFNFTSTGGFAASTPVTIGYFINNSSASFYFDGMLDEIAVYGSALSPFEITQHYQNGLSGNESEVLGDTTAPVITITGNTNVDVEVDTTYSDAGATATDNLDGDITGSINTVNLVDTTVLGTYSVNYSVSDRAGNSAEANRTVNVVDTQAPVIILNGDTNITIEVGTAYSELGATATDNYDGNLTTSIEINASSVDTNTVGVYTVIYDVNDSSGNVAEVTRTVNVVDTQAPVITLNGDANITLGLGSTYIDAGATATDNEDGNLTGSIVTVNPVNTNTVGVYTVTYDVNDSSGNAAAQVSRTVNVVGWFTVTSDSNSSIYTVGDTRVELDPTLFNITVGNDKIVFEEIGSEPKLYIELMSDGTVVTGYRQGTGDDSTVTIAFAAGTKVSVGADMVLLIETLLVNDLTLGGAL
ncbi:DUF5011 domain-containing protein [Sulfurovum sp. XTW-4]|uniref:DUF5011 domain-containing protein n=1 Tax=Sulfurovum xiamenensis TaxID=3019066 RepID=A0ABT7QTI8_9BACT|nr:immunoglobulin-like domain-containing protein [Sulfurovum xiamenensis]MDM5264393.1 DUF5011 domain-containing protein [Sulfurovum xiamenensis]